MKDENKLDIMELAEDRFVEEADPTGTGISLSAQAPVIATVQKPKPKFKWSTILASAACLLLVLNAVIFAPILFDRDDPVIPSGDTTDTSDPLNQVQNPSNNDDDRSDTNADNTVLVGNGAIIEALDQFFNTSSNDSNVNLEDAQDKVEEELDSSLDLSTDINDNQENGISEGDIIKISDKHIFYLKNKTLMVYTINKEKSELVAMMPLSNYVDSMDNFVSSLSPSDDELEKLDESKTGWEMFLSADYKTLTVLAHSGYNSNATGVLTFNVENAPSIKLVDFKTISGKYVTSRMINGELLLFTSYSIARRYDKSNPLSYMPFYIENDKEHLAENVYFPGTISSSSYLMITRLGSYGVEVMESAAYLSYDALVYVSENNIYLTRTTQLNSNGQEIINSNRYDIILDESFIGEEKRPNAPHKTEIAVIGYTTPLFVNKGVIKIDGYLKNQYSLDEENGILRAVTTTAVKKTNQSFTSYDSSASLFCIDLNRMTIVANVDNFAPVGEVVRSVRYEGDYAYVCTSYRHVLVDPVFYFDLSDLENITYTQTDEIDGYSSSLINLGNGYVMGVGVGDTPSTLKIEVFKESNGKVVSIDSFEMSNVSFSTDYKSYYVNRDLRIIGLGVRTSSNSTNNKYVCLYFDGYELREVVNSTIEFSSIHSVRGFYLNQYYYIVTDKGITTFDIGPMDVTDLSELRDPTAPAWPSV